MRSRRGTSITTAHKSAAGHAARRFGVSLALVAVAAALRLWPLQILGPRLAWLTFYPAAALAAFLGGFSAGLFATALSSVAVVFVLPAVTGTPFIQDFADWLGMAVFVATCTMLSGFAGATHRARERKGRAEAERDRFFTLSLDMLCISNADGYFKRVSPAFTRTLGWSEEEMLTRPFLDFVHPDDREATLREVERQVSSGETVLHFENRYRHKDGSWRALSWKSVPQPGGFMYAIARDVTDQREAEERLRRYADEYQDLYNHAPCGYHSLDAQGRIVMMNDTELNWLGYTREEVVGKKTLPDLATPAGREIFDLHFPRLAAEGSIGDLEMEFVRKDGSVLPVSVSATVIRDGSGRFVATRTTTFDLRARKAAEDKIRGLNRDLELRAAQLEAANQELEAFAYSVSHDLRAPLRSLDGFSQILLGNYSSRLDEEGRDYLRRVRGGAQRMGQLIDDLLRLSRITRAAMTVEEVDLTALARSVAEELLERDPDRRAEVVVAEGLTALCDPRLLRVALDNLLGNAWKFTRNVPHTKIEVGSEPWDGDLAFFVKDNGAGFDMAYADRLFGAFQRLHAASEFEGTGIGLATVQRVIARHGGTIKAEAAPGQGATFRFTLPRPAAATGESGS